MDHAGEVQRSVTWAETRRTTRGDVTVVCRCPFCDGHVTAHLWSLCGSGKRCGTCRALLTSRHAFRVPIPEITDEQIVALRGQARENDDGDTIAICNSALDVVMSGPGETIDPRTPRECRTILAVRVEVKP